MMYSIKAPPSAPLPTSLRPVGIVFNRMFDVQNPGESLLNWPGFADAEAQLVNPKIEPTDLRFITPDVAIVDAVNEYRNGLVTEKTQLSAYREKRGRILEDYYLQNSRI